MRRTAGIVAVLALGGGAVACGGDSGGATTAGTAAGADAPFRASALAACLRQSSVPGERMTVSTAAGLDSIARQARGGAVEVRFDVAPGFPRGITGVALVVEDSDESARATERKYAAVFKALGARSSGALHREANLVVAFEGTPTAAQRAVVQRCVRSVRGAS